MCTITGGELHSKSTISKRLKELEIMKKKASVEAYQAMSDDVKFYLKYFYDYPLPLEIHGEPRHKLTYDADEFGITLENLIEQGGGRCKYFVSAKMDTITTGTKSPCCL